MKVIVDDKIPYIREALQSITPHVTYAAGKDFTPELVKDADALIVRTRTRCDRSLLEGSRVQFIATATIGYDHIDTAYCRQAGISWTNAPGCNSASVAQYVRSALLALEQESGKHLSGMCIGIIGVGNVGSKVANVAKELGMRVLLNDPPREAHERGATFVSLQTLAEECDVLTLHVPLSIQGEYPTHHFIDETYLRSLKRRPLFINTSRGEVVSTHALLYALQEGLISDAILDVWENEPLIDHTLLYKARIATPHIAGYSADGKANATRMSLDALCRHFGLSATYRITPPEPLQPVIHASNLAEAYLRIYDPREDSRRLKAAPELFEQQRGDYPLRREEGAYTILTV